MSALKTVTRYNHATHKWELGYWSGFRFVVVATYPVVRESSDAA